jgi:hypothetical protein
MDVMTISLQFRDITRHKPAIEHEIAHPLRRTPPLVPGAGSTGLIEHVHSAAERVDITHQTLKPTINNTARMPFNA